jgi:putative NIF3 family GTP cyclohydrolase 1 type 2
MESLHNLSRRQFVASTVGLAGAAVFSTAACAASAAPMTISDVIDLIKSYIKLDVSGGTVDTVKSGDPNQPVTGIVTTMFSTIDVINKAVELKANFIIAHEPTFYNHMDETQWIADHDVYRRKIGMLEKNKIVVWRFHDYIHAHKPDGVLTGVLDKLGWTKYYNPATPIIINHPGITVADTIALAKRSLGIQMVRYIGAEQQVAKKIAVMPGAWGGRRHIQTLHEHQPDLLIVGELSEWETAEYIRDARSFGIERSIIVLGHSVSEEPGMEWLVPWLQPKVPGISVTHVPSGNPFKFA